MRRRLRITSYALQPIMNDYIHLILTALRYWQTQAGSLDDAAIAALEQGRLNLHQILEEGLRLEATQLPTAELIEQLGHFIETRGYWEDWLPLLDRAAAACTVASVPTASALRPKLLYWRGFFSQRLRRYQEAIANLQEARQLAHHMDDQLLVAKAFFFLGEAHLSIYQYDEAGHYAEAALSIFRQQSESDSWTAAALNSLGNIARHQGKWDTATQYLTESVALWRQDVRTVRLARVLADLAVVYMNQDAMEAAHACLAEAYQLVVDSPHELDKIRILTDIGVAYYLQAAWDEAAHAFRQANTSYLQNSPDLFTQANLANNLGNVLYEQKRWAEAEAYLRQAIPLWRVQNDDLNLGNSLGSLGKVFAAEGKTEMAVSYLTEGIDLLSLFPDNVWAKEQLDDFYDVLQQIQGEEE